MPERDFMTVGELACHVGKTPRAIRLYEELGLVVPRGRSGGNYREYGPEALVRLRWVCRLHDLGLPLNEIRAFLESVSRASSTGEAMVNLHARYEQTLKSVEAQIEQLVALRESLTDSLEWLDGCRGCKGELTALPARTSCGSCGRHPGLTEPDLVTAVKVQPLSLPPYPAGVAGKLETP